MIFDASEKFDFEEDDIKFLKILAGLLKNNIIIDISEEELKAKTEQHNIPLEKFDSILKKMEEHCIVKFQIRSGNVSIQPDQVKVAQHRLKEITCPECQKRTLQEKVVVHCPACGFQKDKT